MPSCEKKTRLELEGADRASSLAAEDHFVRYTLNPKIELLSQTLTECLGPLFEDVVIWIEPCTVRDGEMRLRWAEMLAKNGVIKAGELRHLAPLGLEEDSGLDTQIVGGRNM